MIEIDINGNLLDCPEQDIVLTERNWRFGSIFDPYSTNIELPRTGNNDQLLGVAGALYQATQPMADRIPCKFNVGGTHIDGYLLVNSVSKDTISVTLYEERVTDGALDKVLGVDIKDTMQTTMPWDADSSTLDNDIGVYVPYSCGIPDLLTPLYQRNFGIGVNDLSAMIEEQTGVQINFPQTLDTIVPMKHNINPNYQGLLIGGFAVMQGGQIDSHIYGGAHPCFDTNGQNQNAVTITRQCRIYSHCERGGTSKFVIHYTDGSDVEIDDGNSGYYGVSKGDTISVWGDNLDRVVAYFDVDDYEVSEDDYDIEQAYISNDVANNLFGGYRITIDGVLHCLQMVGVMASLPRITLREFIEQVARYCGLRPYISATNTISFASDNEVEVDGEIVACTPMADALGQRTIATASDGSGQRVAEFGNRNLADDVTLYDSIFIAPSCYGNDTALVQQYRAEMEWNGSAFALKEIKYNKLKGVLATDGSGAYIEFKPSLLGVDALPYALQVEGVIYGDCKDADFIVIDGLRYMVVELTRNLADHTTNFIALKA